MELKIQGKLKELKIGPSGSVTMVIDFDPNTPVPKGKIVRTKRRKGENPANFLHRRKHAFEKMGFPTPPYTGTDEAVIAYQNTYLRRDKT